MVFSRHVDSLKFLDVMLGDQPALKFEESLYLRMLADDPDEAATEAETFLKENSLSAYYDEVAARALMLAQHDVNRGVLDPLRQERIRDAIKGLVINLSDRKDEHPPHGGIAGRLARASGAVRRRPRAAGRSRGAAPGGHAGQAWHRRAGGVVGRNHRHPYPRPVLRRRAAHLRLLSGARHLQECPLPGAPPARAHAGRAGDSDLLGPVGRQRRYLDGIEATECDIVTTGMKETVQHILTFARRSPASRCCKRRNEAATEC